MYILGHDHQLAFFKNAAQSGSIGHAYLLTGPEMVGKKMCAREVYSFLNGVDATQRQVDPDLLVLKSSETGSTVSIDEVRTIRRMFGRSAFHGPYRVVIIDDAHRMTSEAGNALLKVIEEPPAHSVFFLVSSLPLLLSETIRSRCQEVAFSNADDKTVNQFLKGSRLSSDDKAFVTDMGQGRLGFIHRLMHTDRDVAKDAVADLRKLLKLDTTGRLVYARKSIESGDYTLYVRFWLYWVAGHLIQSPGNARIVSNLLVLNRTIMNPSYNHRLALENFLLNLN